MGGEACGHPGTSLDRTIKMLNQAINNTLSKARKSQLKLTLPCVLNMRFSMDHNLNGKF